MTPPEAPPLKQVLYPATLVDVVPTPEGVVLQITAPGSGETLIFPMSVEAAREIGAKLSAPRVLSASAGAPTNGHGPVR